MNDTSAAVEPERIDAVVVGAGFSGMYSIYKFRQAGIGVRAFDAAADVGGTWWWNRYPGARCDIRSWEYSYSFSPELDQEWRWSERYAAQPEILSYANHVADRFDLRRDVQFNTRVTSAHWDDAAGRWTVTTDHGDVLSCQYLIMAVGALSTAKMPEIDGLDTFKGVAVHTGLWPHEGVDVAGKRVGVIGTGSSGIQVIPELAKVAGHVTVFQRTPAFALPARHAPIPDEAMAEIKAGYPEYRETVKYSRAGIRVEGPPATRSVLDFDDDEFRATLDHAWAQGTLHSLGSAFTDTLTNQAANDRVSDYIRERIAEVVKDPVLAEKLSPRTYPYGTKRPCLESGYFEAYNRDNVSLVDLRESALDAIVPEGVRTADGTVYPLDVLVLATGFDAITGPLMEPDIVGRDGATFAEKFANGPRTYLGLSSVGFPNLFIITGPGSPAVLSNMMVSIEQHVDWITDCLVYLREHDLHVIEPTLEAQDNWTEQVAAIAAHTLYPKANSWYMGANVEGKPRGFMLYIGGMTAYRTTCDEIAADGYRGFALR